MTRKATFFGIDFLRGLVERPGLWKTISSVFVFIAALLAVSNYLGGGAVGILQTGLIAIVVTASYVVFYGWIARLPVIQRFIRPGPRAADAPKRKARPRPQPAEPDLTAMLTRGVRSVCDFGPHDVESGTPTKIPLSVEKGFRVTGLLEEVDGYDFSYMILDEDNWALFQQNRRYDVADQDDGESTYKIDWKVPSHGPWFLALEAHGKQIVREVEVSLRMGASGRGP